MKNKLKENVSDKDMKQIRLEIRKMVAKIFFDLYLKRSSWGAN